MRHLNLHNDFAGFTSQGARVYVRRCRVISSRRNNPQIEADDWLLKGRFYRAPKGKPEGRSLVHRELPRPDYPAPL